MFSRQFDLDIYRLAIRNTMPENIGFAMLTDIYDGSVLRVELADSMVSRHAAVHTEGGDDLILQFSFGVYLLFLPLITCVAQ